MAKPRDSQRSKFYTAEEAAFPRPQVVEFRFANAKGTLNYVKGVCKRKRVQTKYPRAIRVAQEVATRGSYAIAPGQAVATVSSSSYYWIRRMEQTLPAYWRNEATVLQLVAYALTERDSEPQHGWEFAECYLYLVRTMMGHEAADRLKAEYKAHKVRFRPKRTMNPEQAKAAGARLKTARRQARGETLLSPEEHDRWKAMTR